jgi:hypothetical protein
MGNGGVDSSILSGSTMPRAKNPDFVDRKHHRPHRAGANAHFYFAAETLFDISLKGVDRVRFLRRQRRL